MPYNAPSLAVGDASAGKNTKKGVDGIGKGDIMVGLVGVSSNNCSELFNKMVR